MSIPATTTIKAGLLKAAIDKIAGGSCMLVNRESSIKIVLTEAQKKFFQDFLNKQLDMTKKPDIEIDALGIVVPVILKRIWPFLAAGGGAIALFLKGRKGGEYEY
jgi:hypothetical protein